MIDRKQGWVVINTGHPRTGKSYVVSDTFSYLRMDAIKRFCDGSGSDWKYWREKFNFRCVRATQRITTENYIIHHRRNSEN